MKYTIFSILVLSCMAVSAQSDKATQLDSFFTKLEKQKSFNGNVLVAENDKIIYRKSIGIAEQETKRMLDSTTVFELASVSKQFTAMGIMLLQKNKQLSYDDSLRKFFPELPYANITIRHLLNHTSGLPDYMELFSVNWDTTKIATNKDMIALLAKYKPAALFAPGDKWEYSNTGYALLASIIEKVSGKSYADFLAEKIFRPLGMKHTQVYRRRYEKRKVENYAYGYVFDAAKNKHVLPDSLAATASMVYTLDGIVGDGTVNSTTGDLFMWSRALSRNLLVPAAMQDEAFTPGKLNNGKPHNYGFGWATGKRPTVGRIVNHSGGWPGYATFIEKDLDTDNTIVILTNMEKGQLPVSQVVNILYNIKETKRNEITVTAEQLKAYEGTYQLSPDFSITVSVKDDHIYVQATGQSQLEIFQEKEDFFFLKVVDAQVKFKRNDRKEITALVLIQNGQEMEGTKIK